MRITTFLLYCVVMASGFWTIQTQYNSRKLFIEIEKKRTHLEQIQQDNANLEVEKLTKATPFRTELIAKETLKMSTATPSITQYVPHPSKTSSSGASK